MKISDIFAGNKPLEKLLENYGFRKDDVMRQTDFDGKQYHATMVCSMLEAEYEAIRSASSVGQNISGFI